LHISKTTTKKNKRKLLKLNFGEINLFKKVQKVENSKHPPQYKHYAKKDNKITFFSLAVMFLAFALISKKTQRKM
jgi:hypothetical protein